MGPKPCRTCKGFVDAGWVSDQCYNCYRSMLGTAAGGAALADGCGAGLPQVTSTGQFSTVPTPALPSADADRKALPIFDGVLMYFPRAIREIARVSKIGNDQHNPGQPLHWAKEKSTDHRNTALRHMMDDGMGNHLDVDGTYHLAKASWRNMAALETLLEQREKEPLNVGPHKA